MPNFIKVGTHCNFKTKFAQFRVKIRNFQISYLRLTNLTCSEFQISKHWECISFLGPNFPEMRGLIFVLMSNVSYLAVILIFLEVTGGYCSLASGYCLLPGGYCSLPGGYCSLSSGYCSLLVVTGGYCSFPLLV